MAKNPLLEAGPSDEGEPAGQAEREEAEFADAGEDPAEPERTS